MVIVLLLPLPVHFRGSKPLSDQMLLEDEFNV